MDEAAFLVAVRAGDVPTIEGVLRTTPTLARLRDGDGVSVVCRAVYHARRDVAAILCRHRDDLDIIEASCVGDVKRVAALVRDERELVNAYSPDGFHPLGYACFFGYPELAEVLLSHGADVEAPSRNAMQVRPLHSAVAHADPTIALLLARRLLEAGASPNVTQQRGFTPLHEAALRGHAELARVLLRHGANPNARNADGKRPVELARENRHGDVAELLARAAADKGRMVPPRLRGDA